jgi:hypothetical protein
MHFKGPSRKFRLLPKCGNHALELLLAQEFLGEDGPVTDFILLAAGLLLPGAGDEHRLLGFLSLLPVQDHHTWKCPPRLWSLVHDCWPWTPGLQVGHSDGKYLPEPLQELGLC